MAVSAPRGSRIDISVYGGSELPQSSPAMLVNPRGQGNNPAGFSPAPFFRLPSPRHPSPAPPCRRRKRHRLRFRLQPGKDEIKSTPTTTATALRWGRSAALPTPDATAKAKTLTEGRCPWRAQGVSPVFRAGLRRLCRPRGFPLSLCSVTSPGRFPSPCTCRPRWRGPGPRRSC